MAGYFIERDIDMQNGEEYGFGGISEGEDESEDGSDEDYEDEGFVPEAPSSRAFLARSSTSDAVIRQVPENPVVDTTDSSQRDDENDSGGDFSKLEIDGLYCPICMEPWTNGGDHQVCCLPCGHLFGISCIKKWLQGCKRPGKCPQCKRKCALKDLRVIYASQVIAVDQELEKKVRSLEAKCASFEMKNSCWHKKEAEWEKRETEWRRKEADWKRSEADLQKRIRQNTMRTFPVDHLSVDRQNTSSRLFSSNGGTAQDMLGPKLEFGCSFQGSSVSFFQQMSLIAPRERETISLPCNTKAVKDLQFSPHEGLALVASLGKKLSAISMESNNVVISYDLPAAAWSCSWDINSPHYAYAGLQNGMLLMFDMRQTSTPVESRNGLTCNPIHTVHSLLLDSSLPSGSKSVLTASSVGLSHWNFGDTAESKILVPGSENQGVCISCAYCPRSNDIVASFRPKVEMSSETAVSQISPTPAAASTPSGQVVLGSHILYRRRTGGGNSSYQKLGSTSAYVSDIRLPKSAIINRQNDDVVQFACGDDVTSDLVVQELPSYRIAQNLRCPKYPIRDVKYTPALGSGFLSCLSDDVFQLFSAKLLF